MDIGAQIGDSNFGDNYALWNTQIQKLIDERKERKIDFFFNEKLFRWHNLVVTRNHKFNRICSFAIVSHVNY